MTADAILAQGHDGRTVIGCMFGTGVPGVWQPLAGPTGGPLCIVLFVGDVAILVSPWL